MGQIKNLTFWTCWWCSIKVRRSAKSLQFILMGTWMWQSNSCWNISLKNTNSLSLMVVLWKRKKVNKISRIHPLGNVNVLTKFHANPSNGCCNISVSTKVVANWQKWKLKFTFEMFQWCCFISRTKHKLGLYPQGGTRSWILSVVWFKAQIVGECTAVW